MLNKRGINKVSILAIVLFCSCLVVFGLNSKSDAKKRTFAKKGCLDCHTDFADKYLSMKNVHKVVAEQKCEECHLRHGIVAKLLLKEDGNELCYTCHKVEELNLDQEYVHTAVSRENAFPATTPMPRKVLSS